MRLALYAPVPPPLHTDFKLDGDGEALRLVTRDGVTVQAFPPVPQGQDQAYGLHGVVLVAEGAVGRVAPAPLADGWRAADFDESDWIEGQLGVGWEPGEGGGPALRAESLLGVWDFDAVAGRTVSNGVEGGRFDGALSENAAITEDGSGRHGSQALWGRGEGWMAVNDPQAFDFAQDFTWSLWFRGEDDSGALISRNPAGTAWNQHVILSHTFPSPPANGNDDYHVTCIKCHYIREWKMYTTDDNTIKTGSDWVNIYRKSLIRVLDFEIFVCVRVAKLQKAQFLAVVKLIFACFG